MKLILQKRNIDCMMIWGSNLSPGALWKPSWHASLEFVDVDDKKVDVTFTAATLDELLINVNTAFVSK